MNMPTSPTRRALLHAVTGAAITFPALQAFGKDGAELLEPHTRPTSNPATDPAHDPWHGLKMGIASYSFRRVPLDVTIADIQRLNLHYVSIKDAHLPLKSSTDERHIVAAKFRDAGIAPLSCGVITLPMDEAATRNAFDYARDIDAGVIVAHPHPDVLPLLDKLVDEYKIKVAIHNHGPEAPFFKSPLDAWKAVQDHHESIGVCIDIGHTARAGVDVVEAIHTCQKRLYDMHFKDVQANQKNAVTAEVEVGRGNLDIPAILGALLEIKYAHHVGLEHEKNAESPLPGVAESIGYIKGALRGRFGGE